MTTKSDFGMTQSQIVFFDPRDLGKSLIEVEVDVIRTEADDILSRRFHSGKDVDFFIWTDQRNNVIKQQMNLGGQVVEWNIIDGVRTGIIIEEESADGSENATGMIRYDSQPIGMVISQVGEMIGHIQELTEGDKAILLNNLKNSPRFQTLHPDELRRRFGSKLSEIKSLNVWKRIKSLFG